MGSEARSTRNAPWLMIEVASSAKVVLLSKSCAGTKSSDLGGLWKPEYIVNIKKTETQNLHLGSILNTCSMKPPALSRSFSSQANSSSFLFSSSSFA